MVHQPLNDIDHLLDLGEMSVRPKVRPCAENAGITADSDEIIKRRCKPGDDILTAVVNAQTSGEHISFDDAESLMIIAVQRPRRDHILFGLSGAINVRHTAKRQHLIRRLELVPNAFDKMFAPSNTARILTIGFCYKGVLKAKKACLIAQSVPGARRGEVRQSDREIGSGPPLRHSVRFP